MNERDFRISLRELLNEATQELPAGTVLQGLLEALASIMAAATLHDERNRDDFVEVCRHQLDINFLKYLKVYEDAISKAP